jgi:hypothetical protein
VFVARYNYVILNKGRSIFSITNLQKHDEAKNEIEDDDEKNDEERKEE